MIYEGDWLFGSNDYEKNMLLEVGSNVFQKYTSRWVKVNDIEDTSVHSFIGSLVINDHCGNEVIGVVCKPGECGD